MTYPYRDGGRGGNYEPVMDSKTGARKALARPISSIFRFEDRTLPIKIKILVILYSIS
uniref:Uncharacterized protein n=1 Tax=Candidatus Kentrum sp. LPFa TaxID=2126335 RepID=A0A450WRF9_9GAMM|nr:MAG: hypothetical protein BECKLPF1236B_GA0070989_11809 [Candidatus Kentron sp. LPFa]